MARDAQDFGPLSHAQAQRIKTGILYGVTWMRRVFHGHASLPPSGSPPINIKMSTSATRPTLGVGLDDQHTPCTRPLLEQACWNRRFKRRCRNVRITRLPYLVTVSRTAPKSGHNTSENFFSLSRHPLTAFRRPRLALHPLCSNRKFLRARSVAFCDDAELPAALRSHAGSSHGDPDGRIQGSIPAAVEGGTTHPEWDGPVCAAASDYQRVAVKSLRDSAPSSVR